MKKYYTLLLAFATAFIMHSANSQTWTAQTPGNLQSMQCILYINSSTGFIGSGYGEILKTTNGGTNWFALNTGVSDRHIYALSFIDMNIGYAVGYYGLILKTTNGGTDWVSQRVTDTNERLYGVSFTDASTGTIVGRSGQVLRTIDGGTHWVAQTSNTANDLLGVKFTDTNTGFAVGGTGTIIGTTNGGMNWVVQTSGTAQHLQSVSFIDANSGFVVGGSGTILKTTNGGTSWATQTSGTANVLKSVCFTDANNGTIAGFSGTVLRTVNGGTTWSVQTTGVANHYVGISFSDANNGSVVSNSAVYRTNNGSLPVELTSFAASINKNVVVLQWKTATETNNYGFELEKSKMGEGRSEMWEKIGFVEGNGTTNAPRSYSFTDKSANGKTSYRLKQIDRDGKFEYSQSVEVTASSTPKEFGLEQNYPNPFNPTTAISYQLSANSFTTLIIYDAIGREVATLVNEVKEAGTYSTQFDGAKLSSGVYFAKLTSSGKTQMKKLLLLK